MLLETLLPLGKVDPGLRAPEMPLDLHSIAADARLAIEELLPLVDKLDTGDWLKQIADWLGEKIEEFARLLTLEQGKPLQGLGSRWEIGGTQAWTAYTGALEIPVKVLRVELHRKPIGGRRIHHALELSGAHRELARHSRDPSRQYRRHQAISIRRWPPSGSWS